MNVSHLIVEKGPDCGREITIPPNGVRIGRSSRNDVTLLDPVMSRFHCRIYWHDPHTLAVADLGSSNQTCVNGQPVQDQPLTLGDRITLGDSVLKVIQDGNPLPPALAANNIPPAADPAALAHPRPPAPHRPPLPSHQPQVVSPPPLPRSQSPPRPCCA